MPWISEIDKAAQAELRSWGSPMRIRILRFLNERLAQSADPRQPGCHWAGPLADKWRYRVGDYRLLARIGNKKWLVLVVKISHLSAAYC